MQRREFLKTTAIAGIGAAFPLQARSATEIVMQDALSLSRLIHAKEVSCVETMTAFLDRIELVNPAYNAIVSIADRSQLLEQAKTADAELARGQSRGWMHGFPIAIKDLAHAEGFVTTSGSPIFKNNVATADSIHVARMKAKGGIVIGKTNVPEFGLGSQSYNPVFGATGCAYDASRTAGGSSGGAASALALSLVPVADGSDMMGSLRNPGAFNNIIGFRPTPGVVPLGIDLTETLACNGPMARTVSDTAMLLSSMAGADPAYPNTLPMPPAQFAQALDRDWKNARIGWLGDFNGYLATEPGVMTLCENALDGFKAAGMKVDRFDLGYDMASLWETWLTYRHWMNRSRGMALYNNPETRSLLKPEFVWEVEGGADISGDELSQAMTARGQFYQAVARAFDDVDFLVLPTAQVFPFDKTVHWPKQIDGLDMDTYHRWMEVVVPGTMSGCPVINVPAGFNDQGLPMGLQIIGPRYQDFSVLQVAYAYEQATRWNLDYPPSVTS